LFGSGLNRPLEGVTAELIDHINRSGNVVVSIDIPSGLYVDRSSKGNPVIRATHTLSFQCYKLSFLMAENAGWVGSLNILDIGLHPEYLNHASNDFELTEAALIQSLLKPRNPFSHKGNFGHALLIAGSLGKMGAALMASKACLRSGTGLLTCHIPACGQVILQTAIPEAIVSVDENENFLTGIPQDLSKYSALGIGPGIGTDRKTQGLVDNILRKYKNPVVIDADGLNLLSLNKDSLSALPPYSILTPHPKEFERLFGTSENDFERLKMALVQSSLLRSIIVLKGHYSFIATPEGKGFFNSTGNAGMAKGGSGDVLTGIITGLLAQGNSPINSSILGTYLHGLAGDIAAAQFSEQAMLASDLIDCLGKAFQQISRI